MLLSPGNGPVLCIPKAAGRPIDALKMSVHRPGSDGNCPRIVLETNGATR